MIGKKFCPNCGSEDVELVAGGMTGGYMCADCGYTSSIFPEKPMGVKIDNEEEEDSVEEDLKMLKSSTKKIISKPVKKTTKRGKK